jgi:photosystem I P700 chlorophyll a apoprotein A1
MVGYVISFGHKVAVIQSYGSLSAYGLIFLGAHFVWRSQCSYSGRGYWQELIESIYGHTTN